MTCPTLLRNAEGLVKIQEFVQAHLYLSFEGRDVFAALLNAKAAFLAHEHVWSFFPPANDPRFDASA